MWFNGAPTPSSSFATAEGDAAVYTGCVDGKPSWTFNGGSGAGGVTITWDTNKWFAKDIDGVGVMSEPDRDFATPCDVDRWYNTVDGETATDISFVRFCGGGEADCTTCCESGDLIISDAITNPDANGNVGGIIGLFNGKVYYSANNIAVSWADGFWGVSVVAQNGYYVSPDDTEYPCEALNWFYVEPGVVDYPDQREEITVCGGQP